MIRFFTALTTTLAYLGSQAAFAAQTLPTPQLEQSTKIQFLPIGQSLPTLLSKTGVDQNGSAIIKEREIKPDYLPPQFVQIVSKTSPQPQRCFLTLNQISAPISCSSSDKTLSLNLPGLSINPNSNAQNHLERLVLLFPKPGQAHWSKLEHKELNNDWSHFPEKSVRIVNLTQYDAAFTSQSQRVIVKPGGVSIIPVPYATSASQDLRFAIFSNINDKSVMIKRGLLETKNQQRESIYLYQNSTNPRQKPVVPICFSETQS